MNTQSEIVAQVASLSDADLVVNFQRRLRLWLDSPMRTEERDILGGEVDLFAKIIRATGRMTTEQITAIITQVKQARKQCQPS